MDREETEPGRQELSSAEKMEERMQEQMADGMKQAISPSRSCSVVSGETPFPISPFSRSQF